MALFSLPPATRQADLNLTDLFNPGIETESTLSLKRTFPPEWFPQAGIQLTWPHAQTDWADMLQEITGLYIRLAFEIATRECLLIVTPDISAVKKLLDEQLPHRATQQIHYFQCPTNDTWARDHGFLSVLTPQGIEFLDFRFNGWGEKFPAEKDNQINRHLAEATPALLQGNYVDCLDFVLEGGSIETDGAGTLLTTSTCLLNPNRNPKLDKATIETLLKQRLGVGHFLWLDHGFLAGDDTDSHVDTLARLCPNNTIAYTQCTNPSDIHYKALQAMEQQLKSFRTSQNEPFRLVPLPLPRPLYDPQGQRLPATYTNFLILNSAVLCPSYDSPETDEAAKAALTKAFPSREIISLDARPLVCQHGSIHCATMQFPRGSFL